LVVQADKGKATVLMSYNVYKNKMNHPLNDGNYFEEPNCKLIRLQNISNCLIERLHNEGLIDDVKKAKIVDYTNTPASSLAIFLKNILKQIENNQYDIENSSILIEKIKDIKLSRNEKLVSFDVISLFPSIPIQLVKSILEQKWLKISNVINISKQLFFDILDFVIEDSTYFTFNNTIYKQIDGSAMGSNLSPILANLIMNELLNCTFRQLNIKPKLIVKYVDDLLLYYRQEKLNKYWIN